MSILLMAVTSFYGLWTGLDFLFKETDTTPDMIATNGAICSVRISAIAHALISQLFVYILQIIGTGCGVIVFILQFIFVWLYQGLTLLEKCLACSRPNSVTRRFLVNRPPSV